MGKKNPMVIKYFQYSKWLTISSTTKISLLTSNNLNSQRVLSSPEIWK